jgi:Xaa-Pro aminopeptidase
MSRTWWVGDQRPRPDMVEAMRHAHEHMMTNMSLLRPGISIPELVAKSHRLADKYQAQKYGCLMHGVGLCDEWPLVAYPDQEVAGAFDYTLQPGMTLCVEVLVSEVGQDFSIKLEDQVVITECGYENLSTYPFDPALLAS